MEPKIIFFGTSDFAIPSLEALIKNKYKIAAVVTQSDREAGRGYKKQISPVKETALRFNLKILQPPSAKKQEFADQIIGLKPELNIVCAYGKILPEKIINIPKYKTINIHPSLLPKYRGPSPIQTAILNGDKETGVSLMLMDKEMDHGPIIQNYEFRIMNYETVTYNELAKQLADKSAELLINALPEFISGKTKLFEQNHDQATFTKLFTKEDGKIYWNSASDQIDRQIRALNPWPGAFCFWHNHEKETTLRLKIIKAELPYISSIDMEKRRKEGEIFKTPSGLMAVATFDDHLIIREIQPEGKKAMSGKDFLNGYPQMIGSILT